MLYILIRALVGGILLEKGLNVLNGVNRYYQLKADEIEKEEARKKKEYDEREIAIETESIWTVPDSPDIIENDDVKELYLD